MKTTIGIDVGGSTTKIVGFTSDGKLIEPMYVRAADPMTSVYGAFGKFTAEGGIELGDIGRVMVTGVGSSFLTKPIYGLECHNTPEFLSVGLGGMYLSGLDDAIVVSMGTGTALIHAEKGEKNHLSRRYGCGRRYADGTLQEAARHGQHLAHRRAGCRGRS